VPFPPGGSNDVIARPLAERLQARMGSRSSSTIAAGFRLDGHHRAACAEPDGYTWLLAQEQEATNQTVMRLP